MKLNDALETLGLAATAPPRALSGGDMAEVWRIETAQGAVVAKRDDPERLAGEAEGLAALGDAGSSLVIPAVMGQVGSWLVMEALEPGPADWKALGRGLAELHAPCEAAHGWAHDNACGATPQPNAPLHDGRAFQRERRLMPLGEACHGRGLLSRSELTRLKQVADQLEAWLPDQVPSLVHGDLWSGNVIHSSRGPALIDPAVYRHYPEVDLAMLTLFGAPGEAFFEAYWQAQGRERAPADWPRREAAFQLYPLLNHLLLFGRGYHAAVLRTITRLEQDSND